MLEQGWDVLAKCGKCELLTRVSPWYPSVRLCRRDPLSGWNEALRRAAQA